MKYKVPFYHIWILYGFYSRICSFCYGQHVEYGNQQVQIPIDTKTESILFLREFDREASEMCNRVANAKWRYATNSTDYNKRRMMDEESVASKFECISWRRAYSINSSGPIDMSIRREFDRILKQGQCGLGEIKYTELNHVLSLMKDNYKNAKICPYVDNSQNFLVQSSVFNSQPSNYIKSTTKFCDLKLDPDILRIVQRSRIEPELRHAWIAWREVTGPPIRNTFMRYLDIVNNAARSHGFMDAGDQIRAAYDDRDFFFTVQDLWYQIQPLYKQLFTFVRKGLIQYYGEQIIRHDGPIPAHLLGNVWAQNWKNIFDIVKPGPQETPDLTGELGRQSYTPIKIFQAAEEFFTSIGLPPMLPEFWRNSMLQKPNEVFTQCKASAWDFCNNVDFRIKQCTQINIEDFINAHQEMTHIHYYMQYSSMPFIFRDGPTPAFHEAISQAIRLSVSGPVHLQKIGLLPNSLEIKNGNSMINIEFLLKTALEKLPWMAFSLALEKWRWYVFEKGPVGMNGRWWELQLRYLGITPPVARDNQHFDAGAKFHVISNQEYIKHFVATILQFQIFAELCNATKHNGFLHTCDVYRSRDAGRILINIMQKGASLSNGQLLKLLTHGKTTKISAEPLLEYFRPLEAWLELQNRDEPVIGWNSNMDDVALYQPFHNSSKSSRPSSFYVYFISVVIMCLSFF